MMDRPSLSNGPAGEVLEALGRLSDEPRIEILTDFTRRLLSRASDEWLQSEPAERVAAASGALLALIDRTAPGEVGVDAVATANNHSFNYGEIGVLETIGHLENFDLHHAGTGRCSGQYLHFPDCRCSDRLHRDTGLEGRYRPAQSHTPSSPDDCTAGCRNWLGSECRVLTVTAFQFV